MFHFLVFCIFKDYFQLIQTVLRNCEDKTLASQGIVVTLSGLLQTNDRLALKEITRILNIDGDSVCTSGSFAGMLKYLTTSCFY